MMMTRVRVDKGAIKFVLKGADVMCPGLTSAGGDVSGELPALAPVAVYAEGKEHALALGTMKLSGADVRAVNKGIGIEVLHFAGDDLYKTGTLE
jgi:PUA domain protein